MKFNVNLRKKTVEKLTDFESKNEIISQNMIKSNKYT